MASPATPAFVGALPPTTLRPGHPFTGRRLAPQRRSSTSAKTPTAVLGSRTIPGVFGVPQTEKTYTVTVMEGNRRTQIQVDRDTNLRTALLSNKVDVYTLGGKLRNCGGGGSCGTCIIAVEEGVYNTNGRTPREERLLRNKPDNFRLACRSLVHGDVTIRTKPQA